MRHNTRRVVLGVSLLSVFTAVFYACLSGVTISNSSVFLLLGAWLSGVVGSMAMISYFSFASLRGGVRAISAVSVGVGICGFVSLMLGIVQSAQKPPVAFSPSVYFFVTTIYLLLGVLCLVYLLRGGKLEGEKSGLIASEVMAIDSFDIMFEAPASDSFLQRMALPFVQGWRTLLSRPGPFSAIFFSCFTEFGVPGILP